MTFDRDLWWLSPIGIVKKAYKTITGNSIDDITNFNPQDAAAYWMNWGEATDVKPDGKMTSVPINE